MPSTAARRKYGSSSSERLGIAGAIADGAPMARSASWNAPTNVVPARLDPRRASAPGACQPSRSLAFERRLPRSRVRAAVAYNALTCAAAAMASARAEEGVTAAASNGSFRSSGTRR